MRKVLHPHIILLMLITMMTRKMAGKCLIFTMTRKVFLLGISWVQINFLLFYRRSNASLYGGNKEDLYDRLRRHAYPGKKSGKNSLKSRFFFFILLISFSSLLQIKVAMKQQVTAKDNEQSSKIKAFS